MIYIFSAYIYSGGLMYKFFIYAIATVCGAGYFPKMPGTFTSLIAGLAALYLLSLSPFMFVFIIVLTTLLGIFVTGEANRLAGTKDKTMFSLDEVPGQWIALLPLFTIERNHVLFMLIGFALFRFFDIKKPGIIGRSESVPGGLGVMLDDIISGVLAGICLQIIIFFFTITHI